MKDDDIMLLLLILAAVAFLMMVYFVPQLECNVISDGIVECSPITNNPMVSGFTA